MSLVAYEFDSSESDPEEEIGDCNDDIKSNALIEKDLNDRIYSNEQDFNFTVKNSSQSNLFTSGNKFVLQSDDNENIHNLLKRKLPAPQKESMFQIKEEEDEFLCKKPVQAPEKPPRPPVKILIPSLSKFTELNDDETKKKLKSTTPTANSASSLLKLLPKPKSEFFTTTASSVSGTSIKQTVTSKLSFVPDSVKKNLVTPTPKQINLRKESPSLHHSDDSDDDGDFFSLFRTDKLPEVSLCEINDMVTKRAAQISQATKKLDNIQNQTEAEIYPQPQEQLNENPGTSRDNIQFDQRAINALVGSQGKRQRKIIEDVQIRDLSSSEILPDRNEWMRSALASDTSYRAKGVLVDEEPAAGTRKKHQITYLAHQAKANEAELQAMWAANRQNRRATANKYGF